MSLADNLRNRYAPAVELDVRHLRVLCAIADTGSVRKAALQLGMTQPSLTTQLRRIERTIGGQLFTREQTGSHPTALGHSVLSRARPIIAEMATLVTAVRQEAAGAQRRQLRIGSVGSRAVAAWLRRIHERLPETDTTIHIDISAGALLRTVAANQLDVALVHESEGFPLRMPADAEHRVLIAREPQFIALSVRHPAAALPVVRLADLAHDTWMVDPAADHEYAAMRRVFATARLDPRVMQVRDNVTAAELVASGEAVRPCQPTSLPGPGTVVRPIQGDPLAVRLLLAWRSKALSAPALDALYTDLGSAYLDLARVNPTYLAWLLKHNRTLLHLLGPPLHLAPAPPYFDPQQAAETAEAG
ncbi:LysR family transcriptional regulator [Kitasatospora sp. GP82]|uniref:LysR family transcriptional regulator n=1 Tax=Kitasatospora sp. GP82 TaxID=3035089 RepID=UPI0024760794|nr:LysR family transcriptional regulator [Kitasatospora sp. GP82]MDH6124971.1 DNA-binding transcriptional LysR family regulator [Kitasatospora sp. GP82]